MTESLIEATDESLAAVSGLAVALRDSQVGLTDAAGKVSDNDVLRLLHSIASERADMEQELNELMRINYDQPPENTSWRGELRTAWTMIRAALCGGDPFVVLTAIQRSEAVVLDRYKKMLPVIAGSPFNKILLRHFERLRNSYDRLTEMRKIRQPL